MATKLFQLSEILSFSSKSHRKAGDGLGFGTFPFFTSSQTQSKWLNEADYNHESIILGTGGAPSAHCSQKFSTSADVFILHPKNENVLAKYVYYFFIGNKDILERGFKGAGLRHLSREYVEKIKVPLPVDKNSNPDTAEQKRIVAILEEAETLKKKRAEADQKMDELIPALFVQMFGDPFTNPMQWEMVQLSELGSLDRGKSQNRPRTAPELFGGPFPFVQTGDITNAGWRLAAYNQTYSEKGLAQSKLWPKNTLCITIAANIARTTVLDFEACFPDSVVGFIANESSTPDYVQGLFMFLQKRLEDIAPRVAQLNINLAILRKFLVPRPPVNLQSEFSEKITKILLINNRQSQSTEKLREVGSTIFAGFFRATTTP